MGRRKNGTNRAAAAIGLNPYGWGNGKTRKRPREPRKKMDPAVGTAKVRETEN